MFGRIGERRSGRLTRALIVRAVGTGAVLAAVVAGVAAPGPGAIAATRASGASATATATVTAGPAAVAAAAASAPRRAVTFVNRTSQIIWVAAAPDPATPLAATGWTLRPDRTVTISTPNNLNTRFWGRTGCVFNRRGVGHCQTGDCGGLFQCKGWGTIPATLAEVNFDAWDNLDFYDVSMVDGSNLPMWINVAGGKAANKISADGCVRAGCTKAVVCPRALDVKAGGKVVGCISACARLGGNQYCCRGPYAPRADCRPSTWPVDYAATFKRAEPYAYSYVDDDATSVFTCSGRCNYRIVFGLTPTRKS